MNNRDQIRFVILIPTPFFVNLWEKLNNSERFPNLYTDSFRPIVILLFPTQKKLLLLGMQMKCKVPKALVRGNFTWSCRQSPRSRRCTTKTSRRRRCAPTPCWRCSAAPVPANGPTARATAAAATPGRRCGRRRRVLRPAFVPRDPVSVSPHRPAILKIRTASCTQVLLLCSWMASQHIKLIAVLFATSEAFYSNWPNNEFCRLVSAHLQLEMPQPRVSML